MANARDVSTSEVGDFTPWLAENIDVLADELGMSLTLQATEVPVREFRLDVEAQTLTVTSSSSRLMAGGEDVEVLAPVYP